MSRVLVVGDLMVDVVVAMEEEIQRGSDTRSKVTQTVGGTAINVATWSKKFGADCLVIGCIGNDIGGKFLESHFDLWDIPAELEVLESASTGTVVALAHPDGERSMFPDSRANSYLSAHQFSTVDWSSVSHLYISGYTLLNPSTNQLAKKLMQQAKSAGTTVVLDPASASPISKLEKVEVRSWIELTDILIPNELEVEAISNTSELSLADLSAMLQFLIVKLGAKGANLIQPAHSTLYAAKTVPVVDSVGAGDAFAGALMAELSKGQNIESAIAQALNAGAISVSTRGAQPIKA